MNGYDKLYGRLREDRESPPIDLLAQIEAGRSLNAEENARLGAHLQATAGDIPPPMAFPKSESGRPSWDQTFKRQYEALEERSTCPRLRVACIAERDHQILASGYNGAPRNLAHCDDVGCLIVENHCVRAVHDAQNLVAQAARLGISLLGATYRSRYLPCTRCALLLIQVGIAEIVYEEPYSNGGAEALDFLIRANVQLRTIA